jgi:hypothetical protein
MGLEYTTLAPGFVKEVLDVYERWEGREAVPLKIGELMMVLQMEVEESVRAGPPAASQRAYS